LKQLLRDILNASGPLSFGRFMALIMTVFCLGWDTGNLVFAWQMNRHLPPGMMPLSLLPDPIIMGAQGVFCTLFYGITKSVELKNPPQPPGQP